MSSVFLFGAGASAFSGECTPRNPPLGNNLFSELQRCGGVAATVTGELAEIFSRNFEDGMAEFRRAREVETTAFQRDLAKYFVEFSPGNSNHYITLIRTLAEIRRPSVFATLNYDLLLEISICRTGYMVSYSGLPVPDRNLAVLKLHGSCNFLPDLESIKIRGISFNLSAAPESSVLSGPVRAVDAPEVIEFCNREDSIAPAIALYARGKKVLYCPDFVRQQQYQFINEIKQASRVFIIGVRVTPEDLHIWKPLRASNASLFYVGPDSSEFEFWCKTEKRRRAVPFAETFESSIPLIHRELKRF